jgi:hypothetical protein
MNFVDMTIIIPYSMETQIFSMFLIIQNIIMIGIISIVDILFKLLIQSILLGTQILVKNKIKQGDSIGLKNIIFSLVLIKVILLLLAT